MSEIVMTVPPWRVVDMHPSMLRIIDVCGWPVGHLWGPRERIQRDANWFSAAPDLLAACEMGDSLESGPALLRIAALVIETGHSRGRGGGLTIETGHNTCGGLTHFLRLKAKAEEAAIARANGQEQTT